MWDDVVAMRVRRELWSWAGLRHFVDRFLSGDPEELAKQPTTDISSVTEDTTYDKKIEWNTCNVAVTLTSNNHWS